MWGHQWQKLFAQFAANGLAIGRDSPSNRREVLWILFAAFKPRVISLCDVRRVLFARVPVLRRLDLE